MPDRAGYAGRSGFKAGAHRRAPGIVDPPKGRVRVGARALLPRRPPLTTRGPKGLQATLLARNPYPFPFPIPPWFTTQYPGGSLPEWAIFWAHLTKKWRQDEEFRYQSAFMGGRVQLGGAVVDFVEYTAPIAINVQGTYYHLERGSQIIQKDLTLRSLLAVYGVQLILVDEPDALRNPLHFLNEALAGRDHSVSVRG